MSNVISLRAQIINRGSIGALHRAPMYCYGPYLFRGLYCVGKHTNLAVPGHWKRRFGTEVFTAPPDINLSESGRGIQGCSLQHFMKGVRSEILDEIDLQA